MKVEIVQVWRNRYAERRLSAMVPPLTSLHLAALVPPDVEVAVRHEKVTPIDYDTDAAQKKTPDDLGVFPGFSRSSSFTSPMMSSTSRSRAPPRG